MAQDKVQKNIALRILQGISGSTASVVFLVTIIISIIVHFSTGSFFTVYNVGTLIRQVAFVIIIALGQTIVLISGGIDLSVANIGAFCSMVVAMLITGTHIPNFLAVIIALLIGALLGALNGLFISRLRLSPFIVTLATGSIFSGIVYVVTGGMPIIGIPRSIAIIGQGMLFNAIPYPAIIMFVIFFIVKLVLDRTTLGRHVYALGGNEQAANIVGVRVDRVKVMVYSISGLLASAAGVLMVLRLASSQVNIGENWLMPSITAAILGGTSMSGGVGKVKGTLAGGLLMGVIATSITLLGISSYWERIVTGSVVLLAVATDAIRMKRSNKGS